MMVVTATTPVLRSGDGLTKWLQLRLRLAAAYELAQSHSRPCDPDVLQALRGGDGERNGGQMSRL